MAGRAGKAMVTLIHFARRRAWVITIFSPPLWTGDEGDLDHTLLLIRNRRMEVMATIPPSF